MITLKELIDKYNRINKQGEKRDLEAYKKSESFDYLLKRAIIGITEEGIRHSHKYRIPKMVLRKIYEYLKNRENDIRSSSTFDEIMKIVYESRLSDYGHGFGSLSIYDTALSIASYFNLYPDKIFLHAGALEGAKNLIGNKSLNNNINYFMNDKEFPFIIPNDLPEEIRVLEPYHIENFLCIYKDELLEFIKNS